MTFILLPHPFQSFPGPTPNRLVPTLFQNKFRSRDLAACSGPSPMLATNALGHGHIPGP